MTVDYKGVYTKAFANPRYSVHAETEYGYLKSAELMGLISDPIATIVDVCAGRGVFLDVLAKRFPEATITSVDIVNFHGKPYQFVEADLSKPGDREMLRSMRFDVVTCIGSLEHFEEGLIEGVVSTMAAMAKHAVFLVGTASDVIDGVQLHLTCREPGFWTSIFEKHYVVHHSSSHLPGNVLLLYWLESKIAR